MSERWSSLRIDEVPPITVAGKLQWRPIRRTLPIGATRDQRLHAADNAGDDVVERHSGASGREEIYVVLTGRASFELNRSTRPPGRSSSFATRSCVATRGPLSPGRRCSQWGKPGEPYAPSAWEWYFEAERFRDPLDTEAALRLMDEANERFPDHLGVVYSTACWLALAGREEEALSNAPPCGRDRPAHARVGRE